MAGKSVETLFPLEWKTYIGKTVFRTNPMLANGKIVIASNGKERNQADEYDGIHVIDPKKGELLKLIHAETVGKTDVNGQAIDGDRIYFGNENGHAYCFDFSGKQIWHQKLEGEVENSPALADFNNDGQLDAVFATDAGKVYVLNGKDGSIQWSFSTEGYAYFMATPTCYDVSADGVPDVLIGNGGRGKLFALDGTNGNVLWEIEGSGIHNPVSLLETADGQVKLAYAPSYGGVVFLKLNGEVDFGISSQIGNFAKPLFLPNGMVSTASTWWDGDSDAIAVFDTQKSPQWEFNGYWKNYQIQSSKSRQNTHSVSSTGAVADVMSDKGLEILWASEAGDLWIFNEQGKLVEHLFMPSGAECPIWIGNLDGDAKLEMLIAGLDGYLYCYQLPKAGQVIQGQFMGNNQNTGVWSFPKVEVPER